MSDEPRSPRLLLDDREILMQGTETVLEALERAGVDAASGCRNGVCAKCLVQAEEPPAGSQRGLRSTLKSQGFFYACQARPTQDLTLLSGKAPARLEATVTRAQAVAEDVVQIFLEPEGDLAFRPGQYLDVFHPSGVTRSYSIASLPSSGQLELHVRRVPEGLVSGWIHDLSPGDPVGIRGAFGQCFYAPEGSEGSEEPEEPAPEKLLLVGAGTGLAPLLGIARDALAQGFAGEIDLIHGGLEPSRLYLRDELAALQRAAERLTVHHCVLRGASANEREGSLDRIAVELGAPLEKSRAFLCGDEGIVRVLQRALFLAGVPSGEIMADPFSPAAP